MQSYLKPWLFWNLLAANRFYIKYYFGFIFNSWFYIKSLSGDWVLVFSTLEKKKIKLVWIQFVVYLVSKYFIFVNMVNYQKKFTNLYFSISNYSLINLACTAGGAKLNKNILGVRSIIKVRNHCSIWLYTKYFTQLTIPQSFFFVKVSYSI